ncbi:hypothetical protein K439DRAFT_546930 [Ramaria rubella]|nr:hypothetical protein K439DRAFT_546930 [Ramaria rubella]
MGFNEFQWRLLNLCGEFYEAATELIRATPHLVLSQAFQLLGRGTGLDPISVLNDARRTCDMMLVNPQAFATAPPPPTALSLPVLTSLAHLNSRSNVTTVPMPMPVSVPGAAQSSYYPPPSNAPDPTTSSKGKEKERSASNVQGTWKEHEVQKLKDLAEKYRVRDRAAIAQEEEEEEEDVEDAEGVPDGEAATQAAKKAKELGDINWDKVVAEFGDERSRYVDMVIYTSTSESDLWV